MEPNLTESEACREMILPALRAVGWGDEKIVEEFRIIDGRIIPIGERHKRDTPLGADYVLVVDNATPAIVEAKRTKRSTADGVGQAEVYAQLLGIPLASAPNGLVTMRVDLASGTEKFNSSFPGRSQAPRRTRVVTTVARANAPTGSSQIKGLDSPSVR